MKRIILLVLCCFCINAYADDVQKTKSIEEQDKWELIGRYKLHDTYIRKDRVTSRGKYREALILHSYHKEEYVQNRKVFSTISKEKYDCENKTTSLEKMTLFSEQMGLGNTVATVDRKSGREYIEQVKPNAMGEAVLKHVCSYNIANKDLAKEDLKAFEEQTGWKLIEFGKDWSRFIKDGSIEDVGEYRQARVLFSRGTPATIKKKGLFSTEEIKYFSHDDLQKHDCKNRTTAIRESICYDEPLGRGKVVDNLRQKNDYFDPGFRGDEADYICSYEIKK